MKNAKRLLILLFAFALAFTAAFSLASCSTAEACNHQDANGDGKCDTCNVLLQAGSGCVHVDADKNATCDKCGAAVQCKVHIDVDKNADRRLRRDYRMHYSRRCRQGHFVR